MKHSYIVTYIYKSINIDVSEFGRSKGRWKPDPGYVDVLWNNFTSNIWPNVKFLIIPYF